MDGTDRLEVAVPKVAESAGGGSPDLAVAAVESPALPRPHGLHLHVWSSGPGLVRRGLQGARRAPLATLLAIVITYPDATTRDIVLGTGMVHGMEASYARLETVFSG